MYRFYIFLFVLGFGFINSCIIQINRGNYYENLQDPYKNRIKELKSFDGLNENFIYEITGIQLLNELGKYDKSLVYLFSNGCKSDYCVPLSIISDYANSNGYQLFLIMNSYYNLDFTLNNEKQLQLFSINAIKYGNPNKNIYLKLFKTEIKYFQFSKGEKYLGSYLFYNKDSLIDIKRKLD